MVFPRFGNRSLDYSGNDTETPKDFILQVPRGRLGIEPPLHRGRGLVQVRKVFPTVAILRIGVKGDLNLKYSPLKDVFCSVSY
jgi:hypothetical protein